MSENKPLKSNPSPQSEKLPATPNAEQPKTLEQLIQEKAPEVLDAIPIDERPKLGKITIERTQISYRSGVLPDPAELAAYNSIIPNGADRIMRMTEAQSAHRMDLERSVITSQQGHEKRGQWFGLIIALFFGSGGLYAAIHGQPWFGGVIAGTTLVSLVGIFVYSKTQSKGELADKRRGMLSPDQPKPPSKPKQK